MPNSIPSLVDDVRQHETDGGRYLNIYAENMSSDQIPSSRIIIHTGDLIELLGYAGLANDAKRLENIEEEEFKRKDKWLNDSYDNYKGNSI